MLDSWICKVLPSGKLADQLNAHPLLGGVGAFAQLSSGSDLESTVSAGLEELLCSIPTQDWDHTAADQLRKIRFALDSNDPEAFALRIESLTGDNSLAFILVEISIARRVPGLQLRRCLVDATWFSPGARSSVSKFCSARCRNRFNYLVGLGSGFVCTNCHNERELRSYSGLALDSGRVEPATAEAMQPLCTQCVAHSFAAWSQYLASDEIEKIAIPDGVNNKIYSDTVNGLITDALASASAPMHFTDVAKYVSDRIALRQLENPEMAILGYLMRSPSRYKAMGNRTFALAGRNKKPALQASAKEK